MGVMGTAGIGRARSVDGGGVSVFLYEVECRGRGKEKGRRREDKKLSWLPWLMIDG